MSKYIKLAHWLHEKNRVVTYDEIAQAFNMPVSRVHNYIKSIRHCDDVFYIKISQIKTGEHKQYGVRLLDIRPYSLIAGRRPTLNKSVVEHGNPSYLSLSDIWQELNCKPWCEINLPFLMDVKN